MKWMFYVLGFSTLPVIGRAQTAFYNNGATLTVNIGATVRVVGNLTNQSGSLTNGGTLSVSGQTINNGTMATAATSTLLLNGSSAQTLGGSGAITAKNVVMDNAAGITLAAPLQVDGSLTLTTGLLTATNPSAPVIFTANGTLGNTPTDASHINGYVRKLGTGTFTFPIGSATRYQPVTVNLSANGSGLTALYTAGNAGAGTFTGAGTEATPLLSYNGNEYWDLTPVTTATGTVTLYWDGVNETAYPTASRRVAHRVSSTWQNEGGTGVGSISSGSITSNSVSSWSPFAMGSTSYALPVRWLSVTGTLDVQGKATLEWKVGEEHVKNYEIEKSVNGTAFQVIGKVNSMGLGEHLYQFIEDKILAGQAYYRILQRDADGRTTYSAIIRLSTSEEIGLSLLPNPAVNSALLSVPASKVGTTVRIYNSAATMVRQYRITTVNQELDLRGLSNGTYILQLENGQTRKFIIGL